jgi:hypothetical protein
VQVEFQHGRKAILSIYHNDEETEQVELQSMQTAQEMHDMMLGKGFRLKAPEEVDKILVKGNAAFEKEMEEKRKRQERARQKMEHGSKTESATTTIQEELRKMKESGVDITAETVRKLQREHNRRIKLERDENFNSLPEEDQISKEQMKEWRMQQWKRFQEQKKLTAVVHGDEL